ncbi:MAG: hypothetical protein ACPG8Q_05790, partial [Candidatus Poseidoniaceae archaeon]
GPWRPHRSGATLPMGEERQTKPEDDSALSQRPPKHVPSSLLADFIPSRPSVCSCPTFAWRGACRT